MHQLVRGVRFSINPFLPKDAEGFNSFASKPSGEGLALFFELSVGLVGAIDSATGFVVNVVDIDSSVRRYVVPVFAKRIREAFRDGKHIGLSQVGELLGLAREQLADKFGKAMLSELSLQLNPFRKVAIDCEDYRMIYFSEKFEFAAMHKLWNDDFSEERNFEVFGKCANPSGHGHNYKLEVTVKRKLEDGSFCVSEFERVVDEEVIKLVDHKNLNVDVAWFDKVNPTIENIAVFVWEKLAERFGGAKLHSVGVWETDKTCCLYYGG